MVPRADDAKFTVNYEDRDWTFSLLQQTEECDWKHFEYFLPEGPYYRLGFHMYSGTVYLDNVSVSTYYSTTVTQEDGTYTTYLYDGLHRLVNTVEKGADHSITTRREYNDDMLPKRIESIQSCMENGAVKGVPITQIEEFEYDGFGNLLRHIGPDAPRDAAGHLSTPVYTVGNTSFQPGETVFQYDTEKYHKVTGRISASDENTILKTEYILDEMGNTIQEKRLHTEDGVSKNVITSLAYDSYGNIISKSVGGEDDTQPVTTYYDYEAAEGGADGLYLTREYMGTDYTRIKRYFYNFNNGLLTTAIEFNEPTGPMTTEYHYDYKCRLSWVKYPDKSTTSYLYLSLIHI